MSPCCNRLASALGFAFDFAFGFAAAFLPSPDTEEHAKYAKQNPTERHTMC